MSDEPILKLPQFYFHPERLESTQKLKRGFGSAFPFSRDVAENYVEDLNDFVKKPPAELPTFWYIEFRDGVEAYSDQAIRAISFYNGELVKVLTKHSGIIKISPADCEAVQKRMSKNKKNKNVAGEIPDYVLSILKKKIVKWEDEKKISALLKQQFNEQDNKSELNAYLSTFRLKNKEEENKLINKLKTYLTEKKGTFFYHNEYLNTFTATFSKNEIVELAKQSFIDFIDPVLPATYSEVKSQHPQVGVPEIMEVDKDTLGEICIIDSGVTSHMMDNYIRKETLVDTKEDKDEGRGHGTLVASIAMFGSDILNESKILKPKSKIVSYNVWGNKKVEKPLHDIISQVYDLERENTNIFNLSVNYPYPPKNKEELAVNLNQAHLIETLVNQNNFLLVNSSGNITSKEAMKRIVENFPDYLCNFSVASPALAPSVFSVGAFSRKTDSISDFGLICVPFPEKKSNFGDGKVNFRAPQIFAIGGDSKKEDDNMVSCLSKFDAMCSDVGTSFAAPLVSLACRQVMDLYHPLFCKNAETVKAIVLSSCRKKKIKDKTFFFLEKPERVGFCYDSLIFNYERIIRPVYKDTNINLNVLQQDRGEFFVPENIESIEFVLVYTTNYHLKKLGEDYGEPTLKVYGISKKKQNARNIVQSNLADVNGPIVFGSVDFERNYYGKWYWELYFKPKKIPLEYRNSVMIRYGLSFKVTLKDSSNKELTRAYAEAKKELGWKTIKEPQQEIIKEKAYGQLQNFK